MPKVLSRRNLFKALMGGAVWAGLFPLINGCAINTDTREEVEKIKWDANPAIPVPTNGCYVGWHSDLIQTYFDMDRKRLVQTLQKIDATNVKKYLSYHEEKGGYLPAVYSFFNMHLGADWFPKRICEVCQSMGVIPLIRFYYPHDYLSIANGKFDNELKKFADSVTAFQKPFFFVPWPVINYPRIPKGNLSRKGKVDSEAAKAAWIRMNSIFEAAGANRFAVWGLHFLLSGNKDFIEDFQLDPKFFDWIGFTIYDIGDSVKVGWLSNDLTAATEWAKVNYPNKPVAVFELGIADKPTQGTQIKSAYKTIKKLPRIKMVMYYQYHFAGFGDSRAHSTLVNYDSKADYREAISAPYFIKGGLRI